MTINFAGVDMLLETPSGQVQAFIKRYWSLPASSVNSPPRTIDSRSICQVPNWPSVPQLKLNQLYIPSGATRWTRGLFLTDDAGVQELESVAYGQLTFGADYPGFCATPACAFNDNFTPTPPSSMSSSSAMCSATNSWNIGGNYSMILFKLDPIPVSIKGAGGLYIVPLVDERYFWQGINLVTTASTWGSLPCSLGGSVSSSSSSSANVSLFLDLATALSDDAIGNPTPSQYICGTVVGLGTPSCQAFGNGPISAAAAMDLACWSQNLMLVPDDMSNTTYVAGIGYSQRYRLIGPGNSSDFSGSSSPSCSSGSPQLNSVNIWTGQKNAALWYGGPRSVSGHDRYGEVGTEHPSSVNISFANSGDITQDVYIKNVPAPSWYPNIGQTPVNLFCLATADDSPPPSNQTTLDGYATTWVKNWYAINNLEFDWVMSQMPVLKFCGVEDFILYDMSYKGKGRYSAFTRWKSLPSNFGYEFIAIDSADHYSDCVNDQGGGGGGGNTGCGCCDCFDCITAAEATVGGCTSAPNGASYQYIYNGGVSPFSDLGGTSVNTTFTYGVAVCPSSSSSSSSSSSLSPSGCVWYSCPVRICQPPSSGSSSSSSSSSSACGVYQQTLVLSLDSDGNTVETIYINFISGTDWMGAGS